MDLQIIDICQKISEHVHKTYPELKLIVAGEDFPCLITIQNAEPANRLGEQKDQVQTSAWIILERKYATTESIHLLCGITKALYPNQESVTKKIHRMMNTSTTFLREFSCSGISYHWNIPEEFDAILPELLDTLITTLVTVENSFKTQVIQAAKLKACPAVPPFRDEIQYNLQSLPPLTINFREPSQGVVTLTAGLHTWWQNQFGYIVDMDTTQYPYLITVMQDPNKVVISPDRPNPIVTFAVYAYTDTPHDANSVSFSILHHNVDPKLTLQEIHKAMRNVVQFDQITRIVLHSGTEISRLMDYMARSIRRTRDEIAESIQVIERVCGVENVIPGKDSFSANKR